MYSLPPGIIKKLDLQFKKSRCNKMYSMVPFDYHGSIFLSNDAEEVVVSANGHELMTELKLPEPNMMAKNKQVSKKEMRRIGKKRMKELKDQHIEEQMIHIESSSDEVCMCNI